MKIVFFFRICLAVAQILVCLSVCSCSGIHDKESTSSGYIRLNFPEDMYKDALEKADLPDTNDFILDVRNESGESIYSGYYGDSPESLSVPPGSYTITVKSSEFDRPKFSCPQYGDEQCVVVPAEGVVNVALECRQINAGIRLRISPDFLTRFPDGVLFVSSDDGRLMYGYSERRIAYFNPGSVSVVLNEEGKDRTLMTRHIGGQEILTVDVSVAGGGAGQEDEGISISVDTTRIWNDESLVIGGPSSGGGETPDEALSVSEARANAGMADVWVCGYIVGGDLTSSSISFSPPFSSQTNMAVAARSSTDSKASCLSVALPAGKVRDALNLVSNPGNLGRRVYLKGDIVESYFGIAGIKNVSDYSLK